MSEIYTEEEVNAGIHACALLREIRNAICILDGIENELVVLINDHERRAQAYSDACDTAINPGASWEDNEAKLIELHRDVNVDIDIFNDLLHAESPAELPAELPAESPAIPPPPFSG